MHQDDKFHTFLLSHFNKLKIYVSQEETSRRIFQISIIAIILMIGIFTIGFSGFIKNNISAESEALLIKSLPQRIMANFFIKIGKHHHPSKVFTREEAAVKWLLEFVKKQ